jgi:hypothetical protein
LSENVIDVRRKTAYAGGQGSLNTSGRFATTRRWRPAPLKRLRVVPAQPGGGGGVDLQPRVLATRLPPKT